MMSQGKTPLKDPDGSFQLLRGRSEVSFIWKDPSEAVDILGSFQGVFHYDIIDDPQCNMNM